MEADAVLAPLQSAIFTYLITLGPRATVPVQDTEILICGNDNAAQ